MKKEITHEMIIEAPEMLNALKEAVEQLYMGVGEAPHSGRYIHYENIIARAEGQRSVTESNYKFEVELYAAGKDIDEAWDKAQAHAAEYGLPKWNDYTLMGRE